MTWDPEKYREKRERVLGIRKRGLSFGSLALLVSLVILLGFAFVSVPGAVSYMKTRHLDDAIYKLSDDRAWPPDLVAAVKSQGGVADAVRDTHGSRLVVTFDRRHTDPGQLSAMFRRNNIEAALLNRVSHRQHQAVMASEKESDSEAL